MGFASAWLDEKALFPKLIREEPDKQTGIIVVVPAYNEPGITTLLDSLALCKEPGCKSEVIIIVNAPPSAPKEIREFNKNCLKQIDHWRLTNRTCFFRLFAVDTGISDLKGWGVGMARKTGMDEALRRFNNINNPDGIIVCLDADCTVEASYFTALFEGPGKNKKLNACSVYFEHDLSARDFQHDQYRNIVLYELHLRYYLQGLNFCGFPYAFHTVGSAMAVKALTYMRSGGMNRRQAGEDFYFIQKLVQMGGFSALNTTTVYPSSRESYRVPFGTGATMSRLMENSGEKLLTYNFSAFEELRSFFDKVEAFSGSDQDRCRGLYESLPVGIRSFISMDMLLNKMEEIKRNTSRASNFKKRFFAWFNMFMVVKYLNFVHDEIFEKQDVTEAVLELLRLEEAADLPSDPAFLLSFLRRKEKAG